jgi:hypothetical protein
VDDAGPEGAVLPRVHALPPRARGGAGGGGGGSGGGGGGDCVWALGAPSRRGRGARGRGGGDGGGCDANPLAWDTGATTGLLPAARACIFESLHQKLYTSVEIHICADMR